MAALRQVIEVSSEGTELIELEAIARSRTEWACWVERAGILLAYRTDPSTYAVGRLIGVTHQTVQRCINRAVRFGVMATLDDGWRPGQEPKETEAWLATWPKGRFTFMLTPKHGTWLNLGEGFFAKTARSMLRGIRVASEDERKARILAYLDDLNRGTRHP